MIGMAELVLVHMEGLPLGQLVCGPAILFTFSPGLGQAGKNSLRIVEKQR
jgi:hypothetical protein